MSKSNVVMGEVENQVRKLAVELGIEVLEKAGYLQIKSPNGHRINIQRSKTLGHVDTTMDVLGQEGTLPLKNGPGSNGSIVARIEPSLELVEKFMRMLPGAGAAKKASGPRPFSVRQAVAPRKPMPQATSQTETEREGPYAGKPSELASRLEVIAERARKARKRRLMEEQGVPEDIAMAVVMGEIDESEVVVPDETKGLISSDGVVTGGGDALSNIEELDS
jgi:hypothetical protein